MNEEVFIHLVEEDLRALYPKPYRESALYCIRDITTEEKMACMIHAFRLLHSFGDVKLEKYRDRDCSNDSGLIKISFTPRKPEETC